MKPSTSARPARPALPRIAALLIACAAWPMLAAADRLPAPDQPLPVYASECGTCHMAYPPALLAGSTWQKVMGGLDRHFGTDASLTAEETARIRDWLVRNAATGKRAANIQESLRISEQPWFTRKHREVSAEVWKRPAIKSAAQCNACHGRAEQGAFNERDIRIPR